MGGCRHGLRRLRDRLLSLIHNGHCRRSLRHRLDLLLGLSHNSGRWCSLLLPLRLLRLLHGLRHGLLLGRPAGRREARAPAVVVHHGARDGADEGVLLVRDVVAVHVLREAPERHAGAAVAPDVARGRGVEGQAPALGGEPAVGAAGGPPGGCQHEVHAQGQGVVVGRRPALALHRLAGQVHGRGARGGLRVQRHRGALEAQREGEAAGADAQGTARGPEGPQVRVLGHHGPLVVAAAHVDAAGRIHQRVLAHAHVVERPVADLQDHALVRVHGLGLVRRHAEHLAVEELDAIHEAGMPAVGLEAPPALQVGVVDLRVVPAHERHLRDEVRSGAGALEEAVEVLAHGEPAGRAAHGYHLALVVDVVHGVLPVPWNLGVPGGVLLRLLFQLLEAAHRPLVQLPRRRDHGPALRGRPPQQMPREEEAADGNGAPRREVLVRHEVRPQDNDHAGHRLHLVQLRVLGLVGLEL
mmetsp:Transcript_46656/g.141554  ORF Transcript_46656/g.141554 Transcript_46656/m.141554 type:complete len:469 (-) Transcript_46656:481-1887(-)